MGTFNRLIRKYPKNKTQSILMYKRLELFGTLLNAPFDEAGVSLYS